MPCYAKRIEIMSRTLPKDFVPFEDLVICSNRMLDGKAAFRYKERFPLLVGKGEVPMIWLDVPSDNNSFFRLVEANERRHPKVDINITDNTVKISFENILVLNVVKKMDDLAVIKELNLRPVGFEVYGDETVLHVGGTEISDTHMEGVDVFVALG